MSCCGSGRVPPSNEPVYDVPLPLARLIAGWDARYPGFGAAAIECIESGNWDAMDNGLDVPAYTFAEAVEASIDRLRESIQAAEHAERRQQGAWHVRWGITALPAGLSEEGEQAVKRFSTDARALLQAASACAVPVAWQGAEFDYRFTFQPPLKNEGRDAG